MKRAIWLGVLALSGCGDPVANFKDVGPNNGSIAMGSEAGSGGTAAVGNHAGGTLGGISPGSSPPTRSVATGGTIPTGDGVATSGSSATGAAGLAGAGPDTNIGGTDAAAAGATSGGAPPAAKGNPFDLVDDMESAFPKLLVREGRDGAWFSAQDDSFGYSSGPSAISLVPARGSSHVAAGLSGGGFTGWGAQLGVSLTSTYDSYDASAFCGLHFWAKGSGAGWSLLVSDHSSMPQGGVCNLDDVDGQNGCYRFVGKGLSLSNTWQEITVGFDELRLVADPASPRRLETAQIYGILFNFYSDGDTFELQVDDLSFINAGSIFCP